MKDEQKLMQQFGKKQPFSTPEGYFECFHEQLMSRLPEAEPTMAPTVKITLMTRIKPWIYMAAMFMGIIFMVQGIMYVQQTQMASNSIALEDIYTEEADQFMYSSLYDEYVLYSYLTTNDYE